MSKRYRVTSSHITRNAREAIHALLPAWHQPKGDKYPAEAKASWSLHDGTPVRLLTSAEAKLQAKAGKSRPARLQARCRICRQWFSTGTFMQHFTPCAKANTSRILGKVLNELEIPIAKR